MLEIGNCYKILHLDEDCSDLQLRQQYRKFALELHPDKQKAKEEEGNEDSGCFLRVNEAYKQIVSYRKSKKISHRCFTKDFDVGKESGRTFSFEEIRDKLASMNKMLFSQESRQITPVSSFQVEVNRIYDEHMSIIDSLRQKLRKMREQ